ncbi:A2ML1 protein, partial [Anseranas semipalmata]|nr:A2ML1 protein [Anseranas semipalmata]
LNPYLDSKSSLRIHRVKMTPPCSQPLQLRVDYVFRKNLGTKLWSVDVVFLVLAKGTIVTILRKELPAEAGLRGSFSLELLNSPMLAPTATVLCYAMLPGDEVVGNWIMLHVAMCFPNQVKLSFPEQKALAGSQVHLKVQAAPGSLCAIHTMDQHTWHSGLKATFSTDTVYNLRPSSEDSTHSEDEKYSVFDCPLGNTPMCSLPLNPYDVYSHGYRKRQAREEPEFPMYQDLCDLDTSLPADCRRTDGDVLSPSFSGSAFKSCPLAGLEEHERADEAQPRPWQDLAPRKDFLGTWLWELVPVGEEGSAEVPVTVPDAITGWTAGMFCTAPVGLGLAPTVTLTAFKPFFLELALPHTVTRGETFNLSATVFNYLRQCLRVQVMLMELAELEVSASADGAEGGCVCGYKARTFQWDVRAIRLGKVNVTVTAQALHSEELCDTEVPVVPVQGHVDAVTKLLVVLVN